MNQYEEGIWACSRREGSQALSEEFMFPIADLYVHSSQELIPQNEWSLADATLTLL